MNLCDFCCNALKPGEPIGVQFRTNSDTGENEKSCACPHCSEVLIKLLQGGYTIEEAHRFLNIVAPAKSVTSN